MMLEREESSAALILRLLLLEGDSALAKAGEVDWDELLRLAKRNVVLMRLAERVERAGLPSPAQFADGVENERRENRAKIEAIRRLSQSCAQSNVGFIFAKAFQHYPDMGDDIDLYLLSRSADADTLILKGLGAAPLKRDLRNRVAGTINYRVTGCEALVEIYHGRMGMFGEYAYYMGQMIRNGRRIQLEATEFLIPSAEDQLVLQGMQRVYRRSYLRLSDIFYTVESLRRDALNWDYIFETSRQLGTFQGLSCYLNYVEQIHRRVFERGVLSSELRKSLAVGDYGRVEFKEGVYKFPHSWSAGRGYVNKFGLAVRSGNWDAARRLSLFPILAAYSLCRRVGAILNKDRTGKEDANLTTRALPANERI